MRYIFPRKSLQTWALLLLGFGILASLAFAGCNLSRNRADQPPKTVIKPAPEPEPEPDHTRPLAVMIDNHSDARPQSGIAKADAVWEAPVEGGLTRDMAIFRSASATEIGPVRSARPYFLTWAREADALYVHVGGSDEALNQLASGKFGLNDVDEFSNGATFWRNTRRSAPHNTYTSSERLRQLIEKKKWSPTTEAIDATMRDRESAAGMPAAVISVTAIAGADPAEFRWEASHGGYSLWRRQRQARDRDGTAIVPKTVVALEMDVLPIADPQGKGLIGLRTIGSGSATVFRNGMALRGMWQKTSAEDPTRVVDEAGKLIPFSPGQVWYMVVGANRGGDVVVEENRS